MFLIYGGRGTDGGFGDYSPPYWSEMPLTDPQGQYVWLETKEQATELVEKLNTASSEVFYSTGTHDQYDGQFPYEYQYREVPSITNLPLSVDLAFLALETPEGWESDTYDWDDEDYDYDDEDDDPCDCGCNEEDD